MQVNQHDSSFNQIAFIKENVKMKDIAAQYTNLKLGAGGIYWGLCPLHDESTASFTVTPKLNKFWCHGCGKHGDIYDFMLEKSNLNHKRTTEYFLNNFLVPSYKFNNKQVPRQIKDTLDEAQKIKAIKVESVNKVPVFDPSRVWSLKRAMYLDISKIKESYEYIYEDGIIAGYIFFSENKEGKKIPMPVSLSEKLTDDQLDTEIVWALVGLPTPRPIYNIMEVIENKKRKPILVVEGERCAIAAKKLLKDFVVTTWSGGANAANQTDWSILESDEVFIWPDYDPTGHSAADVIANNLLSAETLEIPQEKPKGWDIADAIKDGKTEKEITEYILSHRVVAEVKEPSKFDFKMPPHLLGELTQYILDMSLIPHPLLAVGAALSILAILQAQKVMTEDKIHPNLYIITLAPTGTGKNFALGQIREIMPLIGCKKLLTGSPASGAGLVAALDKRQGRALLPIDEFGQKLQQILGAAPDSCQNNIIEYLLRLFSESNYDFLDIEYSDRTKEKQQRVISKPNLVIYGTGVAEDFYKAFNKGASFNGFLARLLVLEGVDINVQKKHSHQLPKEMPKALFDKLCQLATDPINMAAQANGDSLDSIGQQEYQFSPSRIPFQRDARKLMNEYSNSTKKIAADAGELGDKFKAGQFNRAMELASKVALLARGYGEVIDLEATQWAIDFVDSCVVGFYNRAKDNIYEGDFDKELKNVEQYLKKKATWADKKEMLNRFRIKSKALQEVLDNLIEAGIITTRVKPTRKRVVLKDTPNILQWRYKVKRSKIAI